MRVRWRQVGEFPLVDRKEELVLTRQDGFTVACPRLLTKTYASNESIANSSRVPMFVVLQTLM